MEQISGYSSKRYTSSATFQFLCITIETVITATGLNIKTNTRVEHLPESEKKKQKSVSPLQDFLGAAQTHASNLLAVEATPTDHTPSTEEARQSTGPRLTLEQYFTEPNNKEEPDCIGRAPEVTTKTQKLKATVCLAEDFPLIDCIVVS
ncbi:ankyrin repeat domain-containing protein 13B-like [Halichondria panicea]|uniref:ankyrin repeat domain-containing protein 13B-like n=1 Tax=Halichondria panicea TaxID=6063 RepID=UPI00312BAC44